MHFMLVSGAVIFYPQRALNFGKGKVPGFMIESAFGYLKTQRNQTENCCMKVKTVGYTKD